MSDNEKYLFLLDEIQEQQKKVDEEIAILKALDIIAQKYASKNGMNKGIIENEPILPTEYGEDLNISQKVYVALFNIKEGTAHDVASSLVKLQPTFGNEKAFKDARNHLSRLFRKKAINAKKERKGRGYIYSIK